VVPTKRCSEAASWVLSSRSLRKVSSSRVWWRSPGQPPDFSGSPATGRVAAVVSLPDAPTFPHSGESPKYYRHALSAQPTRRSLRLWTVVLVVALFGLVAVSAMRATRPVAAPLSLSSTAWARPRTSDNWPPPFLPVGLENSMQGPDLRSSCAARAWIIIG